MLKTLRPVVPPNATRQFGGFKVPHLGTLLLRLDAVTYSPTALHIFILQQFLKIQKFDVQKCNGTEIENI